MHRTLPIDTKVVIRSCKSKNDRQHNDQKKKVKTYLQNMAQKTNDRTTRNHVLRKGRQFLLHVTLITNQVTSHEWGKDWFVITEHKKTSLQTEILKIGKFINYLIKFHILNNGSISSHGKNLIFFTSIVAQTK